MDSSWLGTDFGGDSTSIAIYIIIAAAVIALAAAAVFILLRRRRNGTAKRDADKENQRISVREVITVDERRRLVLIRRDNIEHLLLTGGDSDLVVESFPESMSESDSLSSFPSLDGQMPAASDNMKRLEDARIESPLRPENKADNVYAAKPQRVPRPTDKTAPKPNGRGASRAEFANKLGKQSGYPKEAFNISSSPRSEASDLRRGGNSGDYPAADSAASPYASAPQLADNRSDIPAGAGKRDFNPQAERALRQEIPSEIMSRNQQTNRDAQLIPAGENNRPGTLSHSRMQNPAENNREQFNTPSASPLFAQNPVSNASMGRNADTQLQNSGQRQEYNRSQNMQEQKMGRNAAPNMPQRKHQNAQMTEQRHFPSAERPGNNARQESAQESNLRARGAEDKRSSPKVNTYAPYLGYMPSANIRPAGFGAGELGAVRNSVSAGGERNISGSRDMNTDIAREKSGDSIHPQGRSPIRAVPPAERFSPMNTGDGQPGNSGDRRAFDVSGSNNRQILEKISPPEDNDFDKILQDELMRSPNARRFPSPQKKIGNGG